MPSTWIGIVLGAGSLLEVLDEKHYSELEVSLAGGILEAVGKIFRNNARIFVERGCVVPLGAHDPGYLRIFSGDVWKRIQSGDASWENDAPAEISALIKKRGFLG